MSDEAVGNTEPCDWCGRPGTVEQCDFWTDDTLVGRNPALCDVCSTWWHLSGDEIDALHQASGLEWDAIMQPFEDELLRKWREKVAGGTRARQKPGEKDEQMTTSFEFTVLDEPRDG